MLTVDDEIRTVMDSPGTSHWLRQALQSALTRDCVDVASDAEQLSNLLNRRCDQVFGQSLDHVQNARDIPLPGPEQTPRTKPV